MTTNLARALRVYLVAGPENVDSDFLTAVRAAVRGGVTMVQLRTESLSDRELLDFARRVKEICHGADIPFLVNDRVDIARIAGADGVHLGVDDLPLEAARQLLPEPHIIGYSPETDDEAWSAEARGASYLGIGPCFATGTKSDAGEQLGLDGFSRRRSLTALPVCGVGGITVDNAGSVIAAGADGVAIVSAITKASDVEVAAARLRSIVAG